MLLLLSSLSTQPGNFWIHPRVFEGEAEDFNEICILYHVSHDEPFFPKMNTI